jgi:hypothetical protein
MSKMKANDYTCYMCLSFTFLHCITLSCLLYRYPQDQYSGYGQGSGYGGQVGYSGDYAADPQGYTGQEYPGQQGYGYNEGYSQSSGSALAAKS